MHICNQSVSALITRLGSFRKREALAFLNGVNDCPQCGEMLFAIATNEAFSQNYPEVVQATITRALAIARLVASPNELAFTLCAFGEMNSLWQKYEIAESAYSEALAIAAKLDDEALVGSILLNLANVQQDRGHLQEAKDTLLRAVNYYTEQGDHRGQAEALGNLANIYQDLHEHESAIAARKESLNLYEKLGDKEAQTDALSNLALIYADAGDISTAVATCQKAAATLDQAGSSIGAAQALNNLGTILWAAGELRGAKIAFRAAVSAARRAGDTQLSVLAARNLADIPGA